MIQGAMSKTGWWFCLPREGESMKQYKEGKGGSSRWGTLKNFIKTWPGLELAQTGSESHRRVKGYLPVLYFIWVSPWKLDLTIMKDLLLLFLCSYYFPWLKEKLYCLQSIYEFSCVTEFFTEHLLWDICLFLSTQCQLPFHWF